MKTKILTALLVPISIPILLILISLGNNFRKSIAAKTEIISARQNAEKLADDKMAGAINLLKQSGIVADSLGSSKVDVCYVTHNDRGWSVANWYQDCYLRYVEGFTTSFTQNEVRQKLVANSESSTYFGEVDTISVDSRTLYCGLFQDNRKTTLVYRPADLSSNEYICKIPNPIQEVHIIKDYELSVKTFKTFNSNQISTSQNQVWITFDEDYYHEDLGCVTFIFCNNPRSKPVHPDI